VQPGQIGNQIQPNQAAAKNQIQRLPGQPGFYGYTQTPWFSTPGVQSQLNLTQQQQNQLNQAYGTQWNQYMGAMNDLTNLNDQQRAQRLQELSGNLNSEMMRSAQSTLSPEQFQRFQQLNLQHQGLNAFSNPDFQQSLKLNQDQINRIQGIQAQQNKTLAEIINQQATDPAAAANQFRTLRSQTNEQLNSILTPEQRQTLQQTWGNPYDFTPDWLAAPGNSNSK